MKLTFDEEKKTMVKIRKLVFERLESSINDGNVSDALSYMALLKEIPPYIEESKVGDNNE